MNMNFVWRVDGNVDVFVRDHVRRNNRVVDRRTALSTVDVNPDSTWGCSIESIGEISGDVVPHDDICIQVVSRQAEAWANVRVKINAAEAIVCQFISDDHVARHGTHAVAVREQSDSRTADLYAVSGGNVFRDGIVVDAEVWRESEIGGMRTSLAVARVRREDYPALELVIHNLVMND